MTVKEVLQALSGTNLANVASARDIGLRQVELALLACFDGISTANTLAAERRREFALLKPGGATRPQPVRPLCVQVLLTASVGTVVGLGAALVTTTAFETTAFDMTPAGDPGPTFHPGSHLVNIGGADVLTAVGAIAGGARALSGSAVELVAAVRG